MGIVICTIISNYYISIINLSYLVYGHTIPCKCVGGLHNWCTVQYIYSAVLQNIIYFTQNIYVSTFMFTS